MTPGQYAPFVYRDRTHYRCGVCGGRWRASRDYPLSPVRVKWCATWGISIHWVELRARVGQRCEERRYSTVVRVGPLALIFGGAP